MDSRGLKQRFPAALAADPRAGDELKTSEPQLAKNAEHGTVMAAVRLLLFITWFNCVCCTTHLTQILGSPLYFINKDYYYAYMALTKQSFGLLITTVTQWFSPTMVRVSGDKSVRGQLTLTKDGRLETRFPERLVMITNHQLYVDWLYFWWISYCNSMHGHIFIILKESLKYIPVIGPGMMFFGFVFMARSWATDKSRLHHGLQNLKARHNGPLSGSQTLDPMWLLMFPEGTNLSKNNRKKSAAWAEKQGIKDLRHQLLPRSTGLQYCLEELGDSVDWVYDCTTAYEGIPPGEYGQDYFTLWSTYFQGRPPKSVNMYWRRFAVSTIPVGDRKEFEAWIMKRWLEKEDLLEHFALNGQFPANEGFEDQPVAAADATSEVPKDFGFIETEVKLGHWYEVGQIFVVTAAWALIANIGAKLCNFAVHGSFTG